MKQECGVAVLLHVCVGEGESAKECVCTFVTAQLREGV